MHLATAVIATLVFAVTTEAGPSYPRHLEERNNKQCAHWCKDNFDNPGKECTSLAARGKGPCYMCGPMADDASPYTFCQSVSQCVDLSSSNEHCGSCGNEAPEDQYCLDGQFACRDADLTLCGGMCVNLQTSREHCGSCDASITEEDQICQAGEPVCEDDNKSLCGGICVDLQTSRDHCGSCGNAIQDNMVCDAGEVKCQEAGLTVCGDQCVDTNSDPLHCGSCSNTCSAGGQGGETCNAGTCGPSFPVACGDSGCQEGFTCSTDSSSCVSDQVYWIRLDNIEGVGPGSPAGDYNYQPWASYLGYSGRVDLSSERKQYFVVILPPGEAFSGQVTGAGIRRIDFGTGTLDFACLGVQPYNTNLRFGSDTEDFIAGLWKRTPCTPFGWVPDPEERRPFQSMVYTIDIESLDFDIVWTDQNGVAVPLSVSGIPHDSRIEVVDRYDSVAYGQFRRGWERVSMRLVKADTS